MMASIGSRRAQAGRSSMSLGQQHFSRAFLARVSTLFVVFSVLAIVVRDCLSGPVRYYLESSGAGAIWFAPDAMAALSTMLAIFFIGGRTAIPFLWASGAFIFIAATIGYKLSSSTEAVMAALKMFLPLLFGLSCGAYFPKVLAYRKLLLLVLLISCAGVVADQWTEYAWEGFVFDAGGRERVAGRVWTIHYGGPDVAQRLGGFSSDSTLAGFCILLLSILCTRYMKFYGKAAVFSIALYSIFLTTSRTALAVLVVFLLASMAMHIAKKFMARQRESILKLIYYTLALSPFYILIGCLILAGIVDFRDLPPGLTSFGARVNETWVLPLQFIGRIFPVGFVTGLGFGLSGHPMLLTVYSAEANAVDNFPLGVFMMFGLPGIAAFVYLIVRARTNLNKDDMLLLCILLFYGSTLQGFATSSYCAMLGMLLMGGHLYRIQTAPPRIGRSRERIIFPRHSIAPTSPSRGGFALSRRRFPGL
jgi:hypothetical protein